MKSAAFARIPRSLAGILMPALPRAAFALPGPGASVIPASRDGDPQGKSHQILLLMFPALPALTVICADIDARVQEKTAKKSGVA